MTWHNMDTWIVVIGALCAASCALPGAFLALRGQSMMGDAISHAVLPGLAAAYLITQSRSSIAMFIGAAAVGVLTAVLTQWVHASGKVERSAAMGIVFTTLFAIGLIMIVRAVETDGVDLDPGCVLYGSLELAPLDTVRVWLTEWRVPRAAVVLSLMLAINVAVISLLFKELSITSFDPELATSLGFSARGLNLVLMTMVAMTTVAAFESIGSILVIAMLIVPAATARLLTDRLITMIVLAVVIGSASAVTGHVGAMTVPRFFGYEDTLTSGMMAACAGAIFGLVVLIAPRRGILSGMLQQRALMRRVTEEDALGMLFRYEERCESVTLEGITEKLHRESGAATGLISRALHGLARRGLLVVSGGTCKLSASGKQAARTIVRSHRLWESYLEGEMHIPEGHLHDTAMRLEHVTSDSMRQELASRTGDPQHDPQGKPIPPA